MQIVERIEEKKRRTYTVIYDSRIYFTNFFKTLSFEEWELACVGMDIVPHPCSEAKYMAVSAENPELSTLTKQIGDLRKELIRTYGRENGSRLLIEAVYKYGKYLLNKTSEDLLRESRTPHEFR